MGCCSSKPSDDNTGANGPTEPKPLTNAASPETNISMGSNAEGSFPTEPDIRKVESSGRATGSEETVPTQPTAAPRPTRRSTHKPRPQTYVGGYNPGQAPVPPLQPARSRRGSAATQPDQPLKSHRPSESTHPDRKPPLKTNELQGLSSASGRPSKGLGNLDWTGQLKERTKPKAKGSFSDVSRAKLGDRVVAVKAFRLTDIEGAESRIRKRLSTEIYVWAALDHPNVLELLGFAFEDGIPCLISPWCDNGTLQEYLQKFPDANRRRLVREIAEGLTYLHMQTPPIIHGDLKTTNVCVTDDHVAKICDFGTSRLVDQLRTGFTSSGSVSVTARYSAPEILRDGQHSTPASDVFSFAYVALETMSGKWPFWKISNSAGIVAQVVIERRTPSRDDHPGMEDAIWELLQKCWNYEPSDRPHMTDVCKTLSAAGYGSSTGFYPPRHAGPSYSSPRFDRSGRGTSTV